MGQQSGLSVTHSGDKEEEEEVTMMIDDWWLMMMIDDDSIVKAWCKKVWAQLENYMMLWSMEKHKEHKASSE